MRGLSSHATGSELRPGRVGTSAPPLRERPAPDALPVVEPSQRLQHAGPAFAFWVFDTASIRPFTVGVL